MQPPPPEEASTSIRSQAQSPSGSGGVGPSLGGFQLTPVPDPGVKTRIVTVPVEEMSPSRFLYIENRTVREALEAKAHSAAPGPSTTFKEPRGTSNFPVPNFIKKEANATCYISSGLQLLAVMLNDECLNKLATMKCPEYLLETTPFEDWKQCEKSWTQFQDSFCRIMLMLRNPQEGKELVPLGCMGEFVKTLGDLGTLTNNSKILHQLGKPQSSEDVVEQVDVSEFVNLFEDLFCLRDDHSLWKSTFQARNVNKAIVGKILDGIPVYVPLGVTQNNQEHMTASSRFPVFLPQTKDKSDYFDQCLKESFNIPAKEPCNLDKPRVIEAFEKLRSDIINHRVHVPEGRENDAIRDINNQLQKGFLDNDLYEVVNGTTIHMKPDCDSLTVRFNAFLTRRSREPGMHQLKLVTDSELPEQYAYERAGDDQPEALYFESKVSGDRYILKTMPVGGLGANLDKSRLHAEAGILGRSFYEAAGYPVLLNSYTTQKYKNGSEAILQMSKDVSDRKDKTTSELKHAKPDCRPRAVTEAFNDKKCGLKEALVFDAWLGNTNVGNGRFGGLGAASTFIHGSNGVKIKTPQIYRTEFECFGFEMEQENRDDFSCDATDDLKKLRSNALFKNTVTNEDIVMGQKLLARMTDDVIDKMVAGSNFGSKKEKDDLITALIQRRESIVGMAIGTVEELNRAGDMMSCIEDKGAAVKENIKLSSEAIRAFVDSEGEIDLPVIENNDEQNPVRFKGLARCVVCHYGDELSGGHYVVIFRRGDDWYVLDDSLPAPEHEAEGAVPVAEYIKNLPDKITDIENLNSFDGVAVLLKHYSYVPYLVGYERIDKEGLEKRPRWSPAYEDEVQEKCRTHYQELYGVDDEEMDDDEIHIVQAANPQSTSVDVVQDGVMPEVDRVDSTSPQVVREQAQMSDVAIQADPMIVESRPVVSPVPLQAPSVPQVSLVPQTPPVVQVLSEPGSSAIVQPGEGGANVVGRKRAAGQHDSSVQRAAVSSGPVTKRQRVSDNDDVLDKYRSTTIRTGFFRF